MVEQVVKVISLLRNMEDSMKKIYTEKTQIERKADFK